MACFSEKHEKHIFRQNWIFRHTCMYKQTTLTEDWNYNTFVQILYSYFRYTRSLFLGCALFVACCNIIRASWETKREKSLSYRKKYIKGFVGGHHFFDCTISFLCHLLLLFSSTPSPFIIDVSYLLAKWLL